MGGSVTSSERLDALRNNKPDDGAMASEPIGGKPAPGMRAPVFTQAWEPCAFLHWPVAVDAVAPLLPPGCTADTYEGRTWVGLIPLVIRRVQVLGGGAVLHITTFIELNVRLYSIDAEGRPGITFLSLDAERLVPVLVAQSSYRLPYKWSRMSYENIGDEHSWTSLRRWPGPVGARARIRMKAGPPIIDPDPLTDFLTARWNLHTTLPGGHTASAAAEHDVWPLHEATVVELKEDVIAAAGLPAPSGDPHVLFSPGVTARIGPPILVRRHRSA